MKKWSKSFRWQTAIPFLLTLGLMQLPGCGADYSGESEAESNDRSVTESNSINGNNSSASANSGESDTNPTQPQANDPQQILGEYFNKHIAEELETCAICHMPNGVADTSEGRGLILNNGSSDYANFFSAWDTMDQGTTSNPLLIENTDPNEPHTGGKTWPRNGKTYGHVQVLLTCWESLENCPLIESNPEPDPDPEPEPEPDTEKHPLLGSSHGNHIWNSFCETADDEASLPVDPRTLVTEGVNENRAVYFNAFYEDCHVNLPEQEQAPKTCGQYKDRVAKGDYFANKRAAMTNLSFPSSAINGLWKAWGMRNRPANFDQLLTERYGFNPAPYPNPYPLPGEDPVNSEGGSGQLPMGLIQGRDAEGNYNGKISLNCYICHGGQIGHQEDGEGLGPIPGMGNTNTDLMILMRDISRGLVGGLLPISLNNNRGTSNAVGAFDMLTLVWDVDTLGLAPNPLKLPFDHSYHGNQDMPNWWNSSHRPRKFFDGGVSVDATRIDMAAADQLNLLKSGASRRATTEEHDQDLQAYVDAQVAPPFPGEIDEDLAKAGAILFHSKDLWANEGNADIPRPEGNGSCASCHGAYSPRYVNDDSYLEDPALEGVASYLVPLEIINTDPARALSISEQVREVFGSSWWGYPDGAEGYVPPENKGPITEYLDDIAYPILNPDGRPVKGACGWIQDFGYLAPPLYGVWASSPYFHNGSVPTLRQVLRPQERPAIWKRNDTPIDGKIKGFDMSLNAYDLTDQVGWKYTEYCSRLDNNLEECDASNRVRVSRFYQWLDTLKDNVWLFGFISKPYGTQKQIDARKIYNTHDFSNSNEGHEFTNVLSETEVNAIIEYMKTL